MFRSVKMFAAAAAFAAPVVLGVAYTGAASIGGDEDSDSEQSQDQFVFATDEDGVYTIDRGQTGDVVSIVITGPDGNVVQLEDVPNNVANAVAEYESADWMPLDDNLWGVVGGTPCYNSDELAEPLTDKDGTVQAVTSGSEGLAVLEVLPDGTVDTAYFTAQNAYSEEELEAHRASGARYQDLEGAQPVSACDN